MAEHPRSKSRGGFYQPELSPCISVQFSDRESPHHLEFTLRFSGWFWSAAEVAPEVDPVSDLLGELSEASSTRAVATMSDFGERRPLRSCWLRSRSWFSSSSPQRIGLARTSEDEVDDVEAAAACSIHRFLGLRTLLTVGRDEIG